MRPPLVPLVVLSLAGSLLGCSQPSADLPVQEFSTEFPSPQGRALELEDYYGIRNLRGARISPQGAWAAMAISVPVEETNEDEHQVWIVPTDASALPRRILHEGEDVMAPGWTEDEHLVYTRGGRWRIDPKDPQASPQRADSSVGNVSPDGFWLATLKENPEAEEVAGEVSGFQARHEERFRGARFDWLNFQRDGADFPAPDPTAGSIDPWPFPTTADSSPSWGDTAPT